MRYAFLVFIVVVFLVPVSADDSGHSGENEDVCKTIRRLIAEGKDSAYVVRTAIEVGASIREVITCAYEGKGNLERIIAGAMDAGASMDTITRILLDAGAEPAQVATALEGSENIVLEGKAPEDVIKGLPGGGGSAGLTVSPSGF